MRRITIALIVVTIALASCGDEADDATATTAEPTSTIAATQAPPSTTATSATSQATTTTTQAPTTTTDTVMTVDDDAPDVAAALPEIVDRYIDSVMAGDADALAALVGGDDAADIAADLPEIVDRLFDALLAGDAEALAALFTDDGVLTAAFPLSTPSAISSMMRTWFGFVDYTDVEYLDLITEGNMVVVVSMWSGTSSTHGREGANPTPFSGPVVDVVRLQDGLIADCHSYFVYDQIVN
jgi:ketosteroid isomerase-like protein